MQPNRHKVGLLQYMNDGRIASWDNEHYDDYSGSVKKACKGSGKVY